jgi:hypothetical protein
MLSAGAFGVRRSSKYSSLVGRSERNRRAVFPVAQVDGVGPHVALAHRAPARRGNRREHGAPRRQLADVPRRLRALALAPRARRLECRIRGRHPRCVVVLRVLRAVVCLRECLPVLRLQRGEVRRPRNEAREAFHLLVGAGVLQGDERFDVGAAAIGVVEAHDLEHAPARGLQRGRAVERAGRVEPLPLAEQRARVLRLVPLRIAQVRVVCCEPAARQAVERVPFEEDFRLHRRVFQKARAGGFDGRDGLQGGRLDRQRLAERLPRVFGKGLIAHRLPLTACAPPRFGATLLLR